MTITKPTVGGDADTWGGILNDALDQLDEQKIGPYLGPWSSTATYAPGSVVSHGGILYLAQDGADAGVTPGQNPSRSNTANGGTDTVTVTTANSGGASGTAWDDVALASTGGAATYVASPNRSDPLAYRLVGTGSNITWLRWTPNADSSEVAYSSVHWRGDDIDATNIINYHSYSSTPGGTAETVGIYVRVINGNIALRLSPAATTLATGTVQLVVDTWYRTELYTEAGVGATARLYSSTGALLEELTYTGTDIPNNYTVSQVYGGYLTSAATFHIDDVAYDTDDWIGSLGSTHWTALTVAGPTGATGPTGPPGAIAALTSGDQIVWAGDVNLRRVAADVLGTDDAFYTPRGVMIGNATVRRAFVITFATAANEKADLYIPGAWTGTLRVTLTGQYGGANGSGAIDVVYSFHGSGAGVVTENVMRVVNAQGSILSQFALMPIAWDATNTRWKIPIAHRTTTANVVGVSVAFTTAAVAGSILVRDSMAASAVYTTDATVAATNQRAGTAVLVAGTVTVANTAVAATSRILLTSQTDGGTPGWLRVSARVVGTSFTISSSSATDTSTVAYRIEDA